MKKLVILLLLIPSLCWAVEPIDWSKSYARSAAMVVGSGGAAAAGLTYKYPSVSSFTNTSNSISSGVAVAVRLVPGVSVTITQLGFYIADPQTATECSSGIYTNAEPSARLASCHCTPASSSWCECTVSYAVDSGTTYIMWGGCNQAYKVHNSTTNCTNYYDSTDYQQDLVASFVDRSNDTGCVGFRMAY